MYDLIQFVPLLPLIGFLTLGLFGKFIKSERLVGAIASSTVGASFIISVMLLLNVASNGLEKPYIHQVFNWLHVGNLSVNISYQVDQLSILFSLIITGVGFLIHIYSIGYMHGDRSFYRFFTYLNLFIFMMLNLVLSSNFLLTFLGWEGVGLCSYLLIGFWYDRKFQGTRITWTGDAANKAFIVNRIGDFGFLVAMFIIFLNFQTLEYHSVSESLMANSSYFYGTGLITAITLLLFLGCTGKSAQIPLAVWLPDAMAGPTPVSALIHAATMVTAGIFLIARNAAMFALSPTTMAVVAIIGVATAFFAATIGLVQNDFKKVLAYSTVSQLGFMFAALGVGAFTAGVFHVMTHAFFKGLLFLGAGSVIHGMHEEQDIKKMGGLKSYMPTTHKTFLVATLAIAGIPFFSGFFSKDEILWSTFSTGHWVLWGILTISAFMTAFYMFRLYHLVFSGKGRFDHHVHPHESPATMTTPLVVLAILSAFGGFIGIPYAMGFWFSDKPNVLESWLHPIFADANHILHQSHGHEIHAIEYLLIALAIAVAVVAIMYATKLYRDGKMTQSTKIKEKNVSLHKLLWNKYYLDEFYFATVVDPILSLSRSFLWKLIDVNIIDGIINGSARATGRLAEFLRRIQTGIAQNYALMMMAGIVIVISWLLFSI